LKKHWLTIVLSLLVVALAGAVGVLAMNGGSLFSLNEKSVRDFLEQDNKLGANMLIYCSEINDETSLQLGILYCSGASYENKISFDEFNSIAKKYFNKTYSEEELLKYTLDEDSDVSMEGIVADKNSKTLFLDGFGSGYEIKSVDSISITESDTAQISCTAEGFDDDVTGKHEVQFGRNGFKLYFKNIKNIEELTPEDRASQNNDDEDYGNTGSSSSDGIVAKWIPEQAFEYMFESFEFKANGKFVLVTARGYDEGKKTITGTYEKTYDSGGDYVDGNEKKYHLKFDGIREGDEDIIGKMFYWEHDGNPVDKLPCWISIEYSNRPKEVTVFVQEAGKRSHGQPVFFYLAK